MHEIKKANPASEKYMKQFKFDIFSMSQPASEALAIARKWERDRLHNECIVFKTLDIKMKHAEEASELAGALIHRQIMEITNDLIFMLSKPALKDVSFDASLYGARLLCSRLKKLVGVQGWVVDYRRTRNNELAEVARLRGVAPMHKSQAELVEKIAESDEEKNFRHACLECVTVGEWDETV